MTYPAHNLTPLIHQAYDPSLQHPRLLSHAACHSCFGGSTEGIIEGDADACPFGVV